MLLTWHFRIDWDVVKWKRGKWEGKIRVPMIFPSTFRSANARFLSPKSFYVGERNRKSSSIVLAANKSLSDPPSFYVSDMWQKYQITCVATGDQSVISRYNLFNVFSTKCNWKLFFSCDGHWRSILWWHEILSTRKGHLLSLKFETWSCVFKLDAILYV